MSEWTGKRIEAKIAEAIGTLIVTGEIKHARLSTLCSVSRVDLSPDGAYATIYISSPLDEDELAQSVEALSRASAFIQKRLGSFLKTRNTPKLRFKADTSLVEGQRINALIDQLNINGNDA
ncbi:MAG: 30S ribosome-binding factor RbfA [Sphaerochaeta sp.]|jgi:ribosome-binding factor A|nr:30S ribosome-binding factor RbfA [Sphaerochaeta sp.]MDX9915141.1 30S ribosome-binding factor RbfA [Sphaerochaeta sp.]